MENHAHLIDRLRSLGHADITPGVETRIVAGMASEGERAKPGFVRRSLRVAPAALLLVVAVPAAAAITAALPDEVPAQVVPVGGEGGSGDLACTGQPPFATEPPEGEGAERGENRKAQAREFSTFRSENCPADEAELDTQGEEECTGAPSFAGEPAAPASSEDQPSGRASEARNLAETRAGCHEPNENAGVPTDVPAGPPSELPSQVPTHVPADPPTVPGNGNPGS